MSEEKLFKAVTVFISLKHFEIIQDLAKHSGLPMSRIINFAIDNELDSPSPFNYPVTLPISQYIDGAYIDEARKIINFLRKVGKKGIPRDQLVLCRRDMGILNRETFMLGYRELLEQKFIEEIPAPKKLYVKYPPDYKFVRLTDDMLAKGPQ